MTESHPLAQARASNDIPRRAVALRGTRDWASATVADRLAGLRGQVLWISTRAAPAGFETVSPQHYRGRLGGECCALVYDAHREFHPDAFVACLGTLRGGGVLYLLIPAGENWPREDDPALARLAPWPLDGAAVGRHLFQRILSGCRHSSGFGLIAQGDPEAPLPIPGCVGADDWGLTSGQAEVVSAVERVALGHARRPLVITADRGRGKSTALGAALACLLPRGKQVMLCAPSPVAVEAVFRQLQRQLPDGERTDEGFQWQSGQVLFRLPARQLQKPLACDLLVIDEAAALGLETLQRLTVMHNRLVFSSTTHGYEGSGRGFLVRFLAQLRRDFAVVRELSPQEPVRWPPQDPLERWGNATFLLDAEPDQPPAMAAETRYRWLARDELAADEELLRQLYGLLVSAHYQTRPSDLQWLLDGPKVRILVAFQGRVVIGAAVLMAEGGFEPALAARVCAGERRPRGHLLLQSLAQHAGWCDAPCLRALRVMRIAVQAGCRRSGIGSMLLTHAEAHAVDQTFDLLGTSFGLDDQLLPFWTRAGYRVVRLGHRVDLASGAHSVQLLRGLSATGRDLEQKAHLAFQQDLPWRLDRELSDVSTHALMQLLSTGLPEALRPEDRDIRNVRDFAAGRRGFADVFPSLWRWLPALVQNSPGAADPGLIRAVLQAQAGTVHDRKSERQVRAWVNACITAAGTVDPGSGPS